MSLADNFYKERSKLAEELGVSVAIIRNWAKTENFHLQKNEAKVPIYRSDEIMSWLEKRK